jgi:hypothetical protein
MKLHFGRGTFLAVFAAIVAAAAVSISIWLNSPSEMRARRLDHARLEGLNQTQNAIMIYYGANHTLPVELKALENDDHLHMEVHWHDPETQQPFEYAITGESYYRLCAVFSRNSDRSDDSVGVSFGKHKAARDCFEKTVARPIP